LCVIEVGAQRYDFPLKNEIFDRFLAKGAEKAFSVVNQGFIGLETLSAPTERIFRTIFTSCILWPEN
jgi:hypothetical protein